MLKPSRFNYTTCNDKNELLIMNFYSGSMIKVSELNTPSVQKFLDNTYITDETKLSIKLKNAGMLIDTEEDEDVRLQDCYLDIQSSGYLDLTILTTGQCNFRCVYCPEEFNVGKMSDKTQDEIIQLVRNNIHAYTGLRVAWFGGEPLLAMDVIARLSTEFIKICKNANRSYIANITTNAYLLSYNVFRELLSYNVLTYQITVDGLKESHDRQRVLVNSGPTYDKIIHNLLEIKTRVKTGKFVVLLRTNFTHSMIPDIPKYFEWYSTNFGTDKRFKAFVRMANNLGGERVHNVECELISNNKEENIFLETILENIGSFPLENLDFYKRYGMVCSASRRNAYVIDSDGTIRKCACKLEDNRINRIGLINEFNLAAAKSSDRMRWSILNLSDKCKKCYFAPVCLGMSCMYTNIANRDTICPNEKDNINYYLKIFDKEGLFCRID